METKNKKNNKFLRDLDDETRAIYDVAQALVGLGFNAKRRVLLYVCDQWEIDAGKLVGAIEGGHTRCDGEVVAHPTGATGTARGPR